MPTSSDPSALRAFLDHPSRPTGALSYHELQGFLFTVVSAPELIPPSDFAYPASSSAKMIGNQLSGLF